MMETKARLMETLLTDMEILKDRILRLGNETDDTVRLSAEIRRVVSLIAEIDHE